MTMRIANDRFKSLTLATTAFFTVTSIAPAFAGATRTPIEHVIIIVGENHTFDNLFGTYKPKAGQTIDNLLSKGIVNEDGTPGPHFRKAEQRIGRDEVRYNAETISTDAYTALPQPYTTWASGTGLPQNVLDTRFPANLPNGPFQISKYVPYAAYTGDPVHRFFQMWQDIDGGKHDKFVWVEETIGTGSNGQPYPAGGFNPMEGAISMGFYNMNPFTDASGKPQPGDAPFFKSMADQYAISDNYHQAIMGGTGANFQALVTGHAAFFTNPESLDGSVAVPYANQIENPDPARGTNNYYTQDGYSGGSYVNCSDPSAPGVAAINEQLYKNNVRNNNCSANHYYLVNNYNMYWNQNSTNPQTLGSDKFVLPPQSAPTIADVMTAKGVSWKYYTADRGDDVTTFAAAVDGVAIPYHYYCGICDPLTGFLKIMKNPTEEAKLQNYGAFLKDVQNHTLPAVSFVRPFEALAGHPADSTTDLYEKFLETLVNRVKANPELWATTAIFITTDEGGGYYDSGYVQPVDFLGDGTRIPFILVSPYAKKSFVDHTYYDHVSIVKFIERNWHLPTISAVSRDRLPNPVHDGDDHRYVPKNRPAIGDLMNMFTFADRDGDGDHDRDDR
ncbi:MULTISPECIES: alkaline phosphatase family protein [unclassified Bradyrhizobium]|uniref:alkaline phosphatase family protein n=1 Tax=unclassified Bradyrhizobium TaxID=2631580 RepID=UPI002479EE05|nr:MULTISPECIES: alkaline phosphatase family protein [unclassified Bradyrhizobium]WGR74538.1 alkaline phosphatase family protein [Bradyrhizobium sp. ISRA426]WGR79373.1 alkaline phosphatase family protein [Bradyrhizobium sp. ISRA430]WGR89710.1 alkaline phosphatase family protein [Bradyrhizobium sp. ISRA432]